MKKILCLLLVFALLLTGCKKEEEIPPAYPLEAFSMTFEKRPQAVLALCPSGEEIMNVLGYGHVLLDNDSAFLDKDYPKEEEILRLSPDLVLISADTRESIRTVLENNGIKYIEVERFEKDSDMLSFLKELSLIFEGLNDWSLKKEQLNYYFTETSNQLKEKGEALFLENFETAPTFLFVLGENFALNRGTPESDFLESIGFINLAAENEGYYAPFSSLSAKPDILIYPSHLSQVRELLGGNMEIPYDYFRIVARSPAVFSFRESLLEEIFGSDIEITDNFMPMPEIKEEEE